jgi:hypothetical protein
MVPYVIKRTHTRDGPGLVVRTAPVGLARESIPHRLEVAGVKPSRYDGLQACRCIVASILSDHVTVDPGLALASQMCFHVARRRMRHHMPLSAYVYRDHRGLSPVFIGLPSEWVEEVIVAGRTLHGSEDEARAFLA